MKILLIVSRCAVLGLVVCLTSSCATHSPHARNQSVMADCRERVGFVRRQVPEITACAEFVARQWIQHGNILMHVHYGDSSVNFAPELWSRAGGLDNLRSEALRLEQHTKHDIYAYSQTSWETGVPALRKLLVAAKAKGWTTVVFASRRGAPADLPIDYLIDNGAPDGSESYAPMNEIVNIVNGWAWCSEVVAALTRQGYRPGVLKGMLLPGATAHNQLYQIGLPKLYPCKVAIPPGKSAGIYLRAIDKLLNDLSRPAVQAQMAQAAQHALTHLRAGHSVWAMSTTHFLNSGVGLGLKSPIKGVTIYDGAEEKAVNNAKPGDLILFFGEWTLNMPTLDYLAMLRKTKADFILSYRVGHEAMEPLAGPVNTYDHNVAGALMVIDQPWSLENAVVPIPFPPGKMAPISGVCVGLIYRMLDEAIANDLATKPKTGETK